MYTTADTPNSEDPLPKSFILKALDLIRKAFACVLHNIIYTVFQRIITIFQLTFINQKLTLPYIPGFFYISIPMPIFRIYPGYIWIFINPLIDIQFNTLR